MLSGCGFKSAIGATTEHWKITLSKGEYTYLYSLTDNGTSLVLTSAPRENFHRRAEDNKYLCHRSIRFEPTVKGKRDGSIFYKRAPLDVGTVDSCTHLNTILRDFSKTENDAMQFFGRTEDEKNISIASGVFSEEYVKKIEKSNDDLRRALALEPAPQNTKINTTENKPEKINRKA